MDLSDASASYLGEAEEDKLGLSVRGAGDVNGDGFDDFLLGTCHNDQNGENAGKAYLVLGKAAGWGIDTLASDTEASFLGEGSDECAGASVGAAGDVDGDGYDDFLVGATSAYYDMGGAYLVLGRSADWGPDQSLALADAKFTGETQGDQAGSSVGGVGDVNGDGLADFAVHASETWGALKSRGTNYILFGRTSGWTDLSLEFADASFDPGFDSSGGAGGLIAGDVNGDGFDDLAFWDTYWVDGDEHEGTLSFLVLGRHGPWFQDQEYFDSDTRFWASGCGSVGDVNGDGQVDLACYTSGDNESGMTHLFFDTSALLGTEVEMDAADASYLGENAEDWVGRASGRGDVNGDGVDDLVLRSWRNDESGIDAGQVYLVLGRGDGWSQDMPLAGADASWLGEAGGDQAGRSTAIAGDVNADGYDDILVGAWNNDESGQDAGQVYLILGEPHPDCPGDLDGDGWGAPGHPDCPNGDETDCDDGDSAVHPGAGEVCDGIDNDCDPLTDELVDDDGDGAAECDGDCDDGDPLSHPGAQELCDGLDNDCDGSVPDDELDIDGDGYLACADGDAADCDDHDASNHPGAMEECDDGEDNDCDGDVDGDDADCPEGDDDSADDDTAGDDDTTDPGDDDCQCRNHAGPNASPLAILGLSTLLLCWRRFR